MADPVVANVFKSGAILWYAPEGETIPDETTVGAGADWGGNWLRVGFTSAPLTLAYESEEADIAVEEHLAPINRARKAEAATLETKLAEPVADYLSLMTEGTPSETAAAAGQVGFEELSIGGVAHLTVRAWGFEGVRYDASDNELPVRVFMPRATARLSGNLEFSKRSDDYPGMPIQILALADDDNAGRVLRWQRVTAPATS